MPPQVIAQRERPVRLECRFDRRQFVARAAIEARRVGRVAVQLDDPVLGHARSLVQPVHILRDHAAGLAAFDEFGDGAVAPVGLGLLDHGVSCELARPGLAPGLLGGDEIAEIDRLVLVPDPARRAEIRDSRFGADAGARKDHDPRRHAFKSSFSPAAACLAPSMLIGPPSRPEIPFHPLRVPRRAWHRPCRRKSGRNGAVDRPDRRR